MSKDIAIQEGDQGRNFSGTERLAITLTNESVAYMVPASERQLETLYAYDNGDYSSSDYYGYNSVVASVTIPGEFEDIGPEVEIEIEDITIEIDPISDLPVIEFGEERIEITEEMLEELGLDGDVDILIDDEGTPSIEGLDELGIETITPITIDGPGETETLPSSIRVTIPPNKVEYNHGESINFEGLEVQALDGSGSVWENDSYPDGVISFGELVPSDRYAHVYGDGPEFVEEANLPEGWDPIPIFESAYHRVGSSETTYEAPADGVLLVSASTPNYLAATKVSRSQFEANLPRVTIADKAAYYKGFTESAFNFVWDEYSPQVPRKSAPSDWVIWCSVYKPFYKIKTITLYWQRPKDGKVLSTSFDITVHAFQPKSQDSGGTHYSGHF